MTISTISKFLHNRILKNNKKIYQNSYKKHLAKNKINKTKIAEIKHKSDCNKISRDELKDFKLDIKYIIDKNMIMLGFGIAIMKIGVSTLYIKVESDRKMIVSKTEDLYNKYEYLTEIVGKK